SEIATSETVPEGSIIEQDIESGEEVVPSETTITFTVSSGRREISMIDLSGFSREEVDKYVDENGLYLSTSQEASDSVPVDQVIRQEPAEGDPLYAGDRITVVFSTGPEEAETIPFSEEVLIPYEENFSEPEDEDEEPELLPNKITIYIGDSQNNIDTVYEEFTIQEDTERKLRVVVEEGKSAEYRIERDGDQIIKKVVTPE